MAKWKELICKWQLETPAFQLASKGRALLTAVTRRGPADGGSLFWGLSTKRKLLACKGLWDWSSERDCLSRQGGTELGCGEQSAQDEVLTASITKGIKNEDGEMGFCARACAQANSWGWLL